VTGLSRASASFDFGLASGFSAGCGSCFGSCEYTGTTAGHSGGLLVFSLVGVGTLHTEHNVWLLSSHILTFRWVTVARASTVCRSYLFDGPPAFPIRRGRAGGVS